MDRLTERWIAARDGDERALADAVRESQPDVWRYLRHTVGADLADDATQDTLVRAWRALGSFRAESSARTWLIGIARRAGADATRAATRRRRADALGTLMSTNSVSDESTRRAHDDLVAALPAPMRDAFVLTQILGYSYDDTARACAVPIGTVRSRVARARDILIGALARAEEA